MSRLHSTFAALRARHERALIPFVTCGDPSVDTSLALLQAYAAAGADVMEIGIPFSDPLADGPTIQAASARALAAGTRREDAFTLVTRARAALDTPLVPMTYINAVYQMGYEAFAARCAESGVDGVIISDLPPEEAGPWLHTARAHDVDTIFLLAPTSDEDRIKVVCEVASGFIYAVARMGVTGARQDVPQEVASLVERIRRYSDLPICAGFGFSSPAQIAATCREADLDGVVVASALIDRYATTAGTPEARVAAAAAMVAELKAATRAG